MGEIDIKGKKHQGTVFTVVIPFQLVLEDEKKDLKYLVESINI